MALTVETGSGLVNADAYVSVAYVDTYTTDYGVSGWTGDTATKEAAIRRATQYLDIKYGRVFKGRKYSDDQALQWPRSYVLNANGYSLDLDEIPVAVMQATAEIAVRILGATGGELLPDITNAGSLESESLKAGPVSISTSWSSAEQTVTLQKVDRILWEFVRDTDIAERG